MVFGCYVIVVFSWQFSYAQYAHTVPAAVHTFMHVYDRNEIYRVPMQAVDYSVVTAKTIMQ